MPLINILSHLIKIISLINSTILFFRPMNLFFKFFYPKIEILLCPFVSTPFINPEIK